MNDRIALINKAELARRLGVTRELVSRWFRADPPSVPDKWIQPVSQITGIPPKELRGE